MAFATDAQIKTRLGNIISDDNIAAVEAKWDSLIGQKNTDARQEITAILVGRGYTITEIERWASQLSMHLDLAIWMIVQDVFVTSSDIELDRFDYLDRRESMKAVLYIPVDTAGVAIDEDPAEDFPEAVFETDRGEDAVEDGYQVPRTKDIVL